MYVAKLDKALQVSSFGLQDIYMYTGIHVNKELHILGVSE